MRRRGSLRNGVVGVAVAVGLVGLATGCGTENASDSCNKGEELEEALQELDDLARDDTNALNADTRLEDLSGNSIGRPFEVDVLRPVDRVVKEERAKVPFRVE